VIDDDVWPVHDDLVRAGVLAPAALRGPEALAWLDCDLALLAESWLGDRLDPRDLDDARRAAWCARTLAEHVVALDHRSEQERCYWLLDGGARAGTIALATSARGEQIYLASLYVLPSHRGRGVGRRAMQRVMDALRRHGLGLCLDTSWCWQRTVRFYLQLGLWVQTWKRDLRLGWDPGTPPPRLAIGATTASLSVDRDGAPILLAQARRRGDALDSFDAPAPALALALLDDARLGHARRQAGSTLALALALHGWPLVRSRDAWERCSQADAGPPEALAYQLTLWEAWARKREWRVETPRIPGLEYPTWDDYEARWKEESRALRAR
jgi:GNAT superfamily N-acetyltransferase